MIEVFSNFAGFLITLLLVLVVGVIVSEYELNHPENFTCKKVSESTVSFICTKLKD